MFYIIRLKKSFDADRPFLFRPLELNAWRMADVDDRLRPIGPIPGNNWGSGIFRAATRI
jgi:hypothetical protein